MSIKFSEARATIWAIMFLLTFASALPLLADEIQMQNGDRDIGRLVSLTNDILVVQSEVLGTLRLSRAKGATIVFGPVRGTNNVHVAVQPVRPQPLKAA